MAKFAAVGTRLYA